jgi:hypothetical protein
VREAACGIWHCCDSHTTALATDRPPILSVDDARCTMLPLLVCCMLIAFLLESEDDKFPISSSEIEEIKGGGGRQRLPLQELGDVVV